MRTPLTFVAWKREELSRREIDAGHFVAQIENAVRGVVLGDFVGVMFVTGNDPLSFISFTG
ncbi:MAG: hypothetical protein WCE63_06305 [Acidobacteriaceae bacterium]